MLLVSQSMRRLRDIAAQVASTDAPVLIHGETGVGKELFARLIHDLSVRAGKPFVPVNCGVHVGQLFADVFFGHEQGAFTGAHQATPGCFESAGKGALFLDEVGEIPLPNQADFLRVLEEKKFRRIGGRKELPFEARIVAATNRDLSAMVRRGEFRADLYFRLNVIPIELPPLRDRREDIQPLADFFLAAYAEKYHRPAKRFSQPARQALLAYPWPGNVRELKNLMERMALLVPEDEIGPDRLPPELASGGRPKSGDAPTAQQAETAEDFSLESARREAEILAIERALRFTRGNKSDAARLLGVSSRTLRYKFQEYGLRDG